MTEKKENPVTPVMIVFEEDKCRSAAYTEGKAVGECEYTVSDSKWFITHTGVRPEYGGRGIARRLVEKVIEEARQRKVKIVPLCSYAAKLMIGKEEYRDVL